MNYQDLTKTAKKNGYVFSGQNASTGTPNKNTGNMSFYGSIYSFETKKEAQEFAENKGNGYSGFSNGDICVAGTPRTLRKYCLGMSMRDYIEYIELLDIVDLED